MKHGALRDMYREHTHEASWAGGALAHRIQQKTQSPGGPGFYLAWRWPALRNGAAYGTQATRLFSPERKV